MTTTPTSRRNRRLSSTAAAAAATVWLVVTTATTSELSLAFQATGNVNNRRNRPISSSSSSTQMSAERQFHQEIKNKNSIRNTQLYVSRTASSTRTITEEERKIMEVQALADAASTANTEVIQQPQGKVTVSSVDQSFLSKLYEKVGYIEEDRYILPEYTTGEVPRVFSSLQYQEGENGKMIATHAAGSIVGSAALIAGTTVGAGVLALPAATAGAGFLPSTAAMFVAYGYMVVSGLLIAELTINRIGKTGRPGTGILDLYNNSGLLPAGPFGSMGTAAYFFLHYAMLVAYIAQGGSNLGSIIPALSEIDGAGQLAFAAVCGIALYSAKPAWIEKVNNVMVAGVVGSFVAILGSAIGTADFGALVDMSNQHPEQIVNCFPILFLAFVYQNVVPTVVTQLEGDRWKIIYSILLGTAVPLFMFLAWNAVVLGNVLGAGIDVTSVDPLALLQSGQLGGPGMGPLVTSFSLLAVLTSIIGFTYGLVESWTDMLQIKPQNGTAEYEKWKPALFGLVFVPPLAMSIANPNVFFDALEYGGAFGVSTLFLILPPLMVWKERYGKENLPLFTKPLVPLGKIPLGSMWKAAGTLIVEQGAEKLGLFHWFQQHLHL